MSTQFASDLRLARRKAGYTQRDIAHLLHTRISTISELENGHRQPTLSQIVTLSVVYGRSFESLFAAEMQRVKKELRYRIVRMPSVTGSTAATGNRSASIDRLACRLADDHDA